jgi:hypothetical protein
VFGSEQRGHLKSFTLPVLSDVEDGLDDYRDAVTRAEEVDEQIERMEP